MAKYSRVRPRHCEHAKPSLPGIERMSVVPDPIRVLDVFGPM